MTLSERIRQHEQGESPAPELPAHLRRVATCDRSDHDHRSLEEARRCTYERDRRSPFVQRAQRHELPLRVYGGSPA